MKALREAVEVGRRAQELSRGRRRRPAPDGQRPAPRRWPSRRPRELFEGQVRLEIGPLGDFSQLVGFEDAVGQLGAPEISVERFSEGRATLAMNLDEPVELLRELEERSPLEFHVRRTADDNLILDVDDDAQRTAPPSPGSNPADRSTSRPADILRLSRRLGGVATQRPAKLRLLWCVFGFSY